MILDDDKQGPALTADRHDSDRGSDRGPDRGLTLLEVLAAFLIFSIVFTVLVGTSQTAVHSQGLALRRLEASLLADEVLADLEVQIQQQLTPILADDIIRDPFEIEVTSGPFAAPAPTAGAPATAATPADGDALSLADAGSGAAMLAASFPEAAPFLLRYDVVVRWLEAEGPQEVGRTTFAFDWETASVALADLFAVAGGGLGPDASDDAVGADGADGEGGTSDGSGRAGGGRGDRRSGNTGSDELTIEDMRRMIREREQGL